MEDCFACDGSYLTFADLLNKSLLCDGGEPAIRVYDYGDFDFVCNNLLLNSSFEDWTEGLPDNWSYGFQEIETVHTGTYSCEFNNNEAPTFQEFTPTSECCRVDLWFNSQGRCGASIVIVRVNGLETEFLHDDGNFYAGVPYFIELSDSGGVWTNFTLDFNALVGVPHTIFLYGDTDCLVYFDDVKICDDCVTVPDPPDLPM